MSLFCLPLLFASTQFAPLETISAPVLDLKSTIPGDFDGDGDVDLIALDRVVERSVYLEAASPGAFARPRPVDLGDSVVEGGVAHDLTDDGVLDLLIATRVGLTDLLLCEGRGDGTFEAPRSLGGLSSPNGTPRIVDLNQDGRLDILASGRGSLFTRLTFFQGLGGGAFAPPRQLSSDPSNDAQALDVDGDGDLDLLVASELLDLVLLLNDGAEQFFFGADLTSFTGIDQVELLDLDGDGDLDAIAKQSYDSRVFAFENLGGGAFGPRQDYQPGTAGIARIALVDVDRDGREDVAVFSDASEPPVWLRNENGFQLGAAQALAPDENGRVAAVDLADLNGDGLTDFAISTVRGKVKVLMSDGSLSAIPYETQARVVLDQVPGMADVAALDLDADGDLDVVGVTEAGSLYLATGRGYGRWDSPLGLGQTAGTSFEPVDLDGDGDVDILTVDEVGRPVLLENFGGGGLTPRVLTAGGLAPGSRVEAADVDQDGDLDLVGYSSSFSVMVALQSAGTFLPPTAVRTFTGPVRHTLAVDLDEDGIADIAAVVQSASGQFPRPRRLVWLRGLGSGAFAAPFLVAEGLASASRPTAVDLGGQGYLDFVWMSTLERAGFAAISTVPGAYAVLDLGVDTGGAGAAFVVGDLGGDGRQDLLVSGSPNGSVAETLRLYERSGPAFSPFEEVLAQGLGDVSSLRLVDLDADGDEDVLLAATSGPELAWIENQRLGPIGASYCGPAVPNGLGRSATVQAVGSDRVALNGLSLRALDLPPGAAGIFLASQTQGFVPSVTGSVGALCLGGAIGRFQAPGQVQAATADGVIQLSVDLALLPQPGGAQAAGPGTLWFFQAWYRDTSAGQPVSNFTDGLAIVFR